MIEGKCKSMRVLPFFVLFSFAQANRSDRAEAKGMLPSFFPFFFFPLLSRDTGPRPPMGFPY